ncbi:MAG: hypothetical protein RXP77_03360 [Nitrososphaeria archaeon]
MGCPTPRIILEFWYPSDVELVGRLSSRGLVDAAFAQDLPFGTVNADSLVAALSVQSLGVTAIAAVPLGSRSSAASVSGLGGVLIIAGDTKSCADSLDVLEALRFAASLPNVPEGIRVSIYFRPALRERECFLRAAAVDPGSERSVSFAPAKVEAGANLLMSQLMADPASAAGALERLEPLGVAVALGVPYAPTEGARARFESLFGARALEPREMLRSLESVPRRLRRSLYVSPIGRSREGLEGFLESALSLVG